MSDSKTRHKAKMLQDGREVIILGYRKKTNDFLVCFPDGLNTVEADALRNIVSSDDAQKKDYLLGDGGPLMASHHPSGSDWQTFLIRQAARGGRTVRTVTAKDLEFANADQKAFFGGYGTPIDPETEAAKQKLAQAVEAGQVVPSPIPAPAPAVNDALVTALASIAEGQQAILEQLSKLNKPTRRKAPAKKRKPATKSKTASKAAPTDADKNQPDVGVMEIFPTHSEAPTGNLSTE